MKLTCSPGERFGRLVVVGDVPSQPKRRRVLCRCDCGEERVVFVSNLNRGHTQSCGCLRKDERPFAPGQRFGRLIVIAEAEQAGRYRVWLCQCECGQLTATRGTSLRNGHTTSCGCLRRENSAEAARVHGLHNHPLYVTWRGIVERCTNPQCRAWCRYGGRGILLCERWRDVGTFIADLTAEIGEKPGAEYSIDRIDNDGHYEPGNIRWATPKQQRANQRPTRATR